MAEEFLHAHNLRLDRLQGPAKLSPTGTTYGDGAVVCDCLLCDPLGRDSDNAVEYAARLVEGAVSHCPRVLPTPSAHRELGPSPSPRFR